MAVTNIAAYRFAALGGLKPLREHLRTFCRERSLKGSILLSTEGINLFVAGERTAVEELLAELRRIPGLESLTPKVSESAEQPFTRMLVKVKKEIISFGVPGIDPVNKPSPKVKPKELRRWLDEGRDLVLLDTRNDYEVKLGTFRNAIPIGIDHFTDFPAAVAKLPEALKTKTIVTFCTGGIRCEKAGPFMEQAGFRNVFQVEGGILQYFEDCGGTHYDGECFVFDKRVSVDPSLGESRQAQCFACQAALTEAEQNDPRFVEGKSCPHCFRSPEELRKRELERHREAIRKAVEPLPGSIPEENRRPMKVGAEHEGMTVRRFLDRLIQHAPTAVPGLSVVDSDNLPVSPDRIVKPGERYFHVQPANIEPDVNAAIELLYEDDAIIVVNKPAPLPIHPSGRFNRNTLQAILATAYAPQKPRPAHRLDANTTGIVVFTRTRHFAHKLQPQFEHGEVEKLYIARIVGHPPEDAFVCEAPIADEPCEAGGRLIDPAGLPARTEFRVLERLPDGTSRIEAVPRTGRTNQIRVHLWHLGWPILGDPLYLPGGILGTSQTLNVNDPPMHLHAKRLTFTHPLTLERATFEAPEPA
jgi:RluA family pseudouridine synthase